MRLLRLIPPYAWLAGILLVLFGCAGLALYGVMQVERGEHLPKVDWLPESASNISFLRSYNRTAYEFDIDERGYRAWVDYPVQEIAEPFSIMRYSLSAENRMHEGDTSRPDYPLATIRSGLFYERRWSNGGGVATAFDREKQRAYFQSNPR